MPNWCNNTLTLIGKSENIKAFLMNVYTTLKENTTNKDFFKLHPKNEMYCSDVTCNDIDLYKLNSTVINAFNETAIVLQYQTAWSPNLTDTINAARIFWLNTEHEYEEISMGIFGKAKYTFETDQYLEVELSEDEIAECSDGEGGSDYEKLETLLNKKTYVKTSISDTV